MWSRTHWPAVPLQTWECNFSDYLVKSTAVCFAFTDPASTAKALTDATKGNEFIKPKGGFMSGQTLNAAQVKALADMPPLPVVRAQLLGMLQAPAWQTGPHDRRTRTWFGCCSQGFLRESERSECRSVIGLIITHSIKFISTQGVLSNG